METILELKYSYDLLDLKNYLEEEGVDTTDGICLYNAISSYFEEIFTSKITYFDNYDEKISQIVKIFKISIDNE
jgi:hypothetical protein